MSRNLQELILPFTKKGPSNKALELGIKHYLGPRRGGGSRNLNKPVLKLKLQGKGGKF